MSTVVISGSAGFIGGYVCEELLRRGHDVVGIDNYSKYGKVEKSYDAHPRYTFIEGDVRDVRLMTELLADSDLLVLATPHRAYRGIEPAVPVIDVWNFFGQGVAV